MRPFRREPGEGLEIRLGSKRTGAEALPVKLDPNYVELSIMSAGYRGEAVLDPKEIEGSPRNGIADVVVVTGDARIYYWGNASIALKAARVLIAREK